MINNSEDFSRVYSDLLSRHQYRDLVGLLSSTTFNDDATRDTATKLMEKFQEQADIEDRLLQNADPATRSAYNFITTGPSKNDAEVEGSFSSRFMQDWNSLADDEGNIRINLRTGETYNKFISSLGKNEADVRQKGIELTSNYGIRFKSDSTNKIEIFNALKNSGFADYAVFRDKAALEMSNAGEPYISPADDPNRDIVYTKIASMLNTVNDANDTYSKLLKDVKPYLNEMIVTGYMGEDDRQLQQSFSAGLLDLQSFKAMREILEEKYNRVLQTKSLSQYDVWAMNEDNEGSQVLEPLEDNLAKSEIDVEINQAIADGRLHYSHATNGLDIGTMLVIDPKVDKDGKVVGDSKPRRFFVKDLFRSQAENALRDDTQTAAQMQYAKHQTYKHIYRGTDGSTISDWSPDTDSAIYTDKNGVQQVVGKAQALEILDNDIIAKRMVSYYDLANQVDKDGNGYTPEYFKIYGGNGFNSADLYNNISARCLAAMAQKYQGQSQEYIKYKANELVSTILKGLGVNFDNDILQNNPQNVTQVLLQNRGANVN